MAAAAMAVFRSSAARLRGSSMARGASSHARAPAAAPLPATRSLPADDEARVHALLFSIFPFLVCAGDAGRRILCKPGRACVCVAPWLPSQPTAPRSPSQPCARTPHGCCHCCPQSIVSRPVAENVHPRRVPGLGGGGSAHKYQ